jgi:SHS2 domain-containing protein
MPFRYLEDLSYADAAFEATGRTLEELFSESAIATFEVMADTKTVKQLLTREIILENESVDGLLIDWLSELIFLKDTETLLFSVFVVNIRKNGFYVLKAEAKGEKIDREKHSLRSDVKAVTYHMFEVTKTGDNWTARVVLDI